MEPTVYGLGSGAILDWLSETFAGSNQVGLPREGKERNKARSENRALFYFHAPFIALDKGMKGVPDAYFKMTILRSVDMSSVSNW